MDNVITATFDAGSRTAVAQPGLYQWDFGQTLVIEGLDLPASYQVDFGTREFCGETVAAVGTAEGVAIPSELLTKGRNLYAFVWILNSQGGRTEYRVTIPVTPRPIPEAPMPSPEEESAIAQALGALNEGVATAEAAAETAETSATAAAASAAAAAESAEQAEAAAAQLGPTVERLEGEVEDLSEAVAGKQGTAISDAGGYFDTDTVEGALQQLGGETAELDGKLPGYYFENNYIQGRIDTILANIAASETLDGDDFFFFTDPHCWQLRTTNRQNAMNQWKLIKFIQERTGIRKVFCGGDLVSGDSTPAQCTALFSAFTDRVSPIWRDMYLALGNHEWNNADQQHGTYELGISQLYSQLLRGRESEFHAIDFRGDYWIDNEAQRIRYFVLGCNAGSSLAVLQMHWLAQQLLLTPAGYTVVLISHVGLTADGTDWHSNFGTVMSILDAVQTKGTVTVVSTDYDFSATMLTVACVLSGHNHRDKFLRSEAGIPVFSTTCDRGPTSTSAEEFNRVRAFGTIGEQAIDVVHIDTAAHTVKLTRIGGNWDGTGAVQNPDRSATYTGAGGHAETDLTTDKLHGFQLEIERTGDAGVAGWEQVQAQPTWVAGGVTASTGKTTSATNRIRTGLIQGLSCDALRITMPKNVEAVAFAYRYTVGEGGYIGPVTTIYKGAPETGVCVIPTGQLGLGYVLVFRYLDDSDISTTVGAQITITLCTAPKRSTVDALRDFADSGEAAFDGQAFRWECGQITASGVLQVRDWVMRTLPMPISQDMRLSFEGVVTDGAGIDRSAFAAFYDAQGSFLSGTRTALIDSGAAVTDVTPPTGAVSMRLTYGYGSADNVVLTDIPGMMADFVVRVQRAGGGGGSGVTEEQLRQAILEHGEISDILAEHTTEDPVTAYGVTVTPSGNNDGWFEIDGSFDFEDDPPSMVTFPLFTDVEFKRRNYLVDLRYDDPITGSSIHMPTDLHVGLYVENYGPTLDCSVMQLYSDPGVPWDVSLVLDPSIEYDFPMNVFLTVRTLDSGLTFPDSDADEPGTYKLVCDADSGDISDFRFVPDSGGDPIQVSGTTPTITGEAGQRYVCGEVTNLSITPPQVGIIDVVWESGLTPTVLALPATVKMPTWWSGCEAGVTYEISIQDGTLGAVMSWET